MADHPRAGLRRKGRPRRVFIGPIDVAGYFGNLADGFRAAGVPVVFMDDTPDPFRYRQPSVHVLVARALVAAIARSRAGGARAGWRLAAVALRALRLLLHVIVLVVAAVRCDTFIYSSGAGLLRGRELPLMRLLGKRVIWVFTGSDHRPPYLNGRMIRTARTDGWPALAQATRRTRDAVALAEKHADFIVAHTASAQFHRRPFVRFLSVGIPVLEVPAHPASRARIDGADPAAPIAIVHGPSDPQSKGTAVVRGIVERLADLGRAIDYQELTNTRHAEVLATLMGADLLVNEVWSDTPMGVLGAEAAIRSVPSVSGGYYAAALIADTPAESLPPAAFVLPEELEEAVRQLVVDDVARRDLGRRARMFVAQRWSPRAVADRYLQLLDGTAPTDWFVDPASLAYVGGCGIARDERIAALRDHVAQAGAEALLLPEGSRALELIAREVKA